MPSVAWRPRRDIRRRGAACRSTCAGGFARIPQTAQRRCAGRLPPRAAAKRGKCRNLGRVTAEALGMTQRGSRRRKKNISCQPHCLHSDSPPAPRKESALLKEWTSAELLRKEVVQTYKWAAEIAPAFQQWEALNDAFAGDSKWKDLRQNAMEAARLNLCRSTRVSTSPAPPRRGCGLFDSTGAHTASVDLTQLERYIVRCQENNDAGSSAGRANTGRDNRSASRPTGTNNYYSGRYPNVGVRGRGRAAAEATEEEAPEGDTLTGMSTSATTPLQMQETDTPTEFRPYSVGYHMTPQFGEVIFSKAEPRMAKSTTFWLVTSHMAPCSRAAHWWISLLHP
eukprot:gene6463-4653_t